MSLNDLYIDVDISIKNSQLLTELKVFQNNLQLKPNGFRRTAYYRKALDFERSEGVLYIQFLCVKLFNNNFPIHLEQE